MTAYKHQVALLLQVLPEIAKESCFALHGGTAINLFVRNMPRLSVDIDLTYIPIEDRKTSFANIQAALNNCKSNIEKLDSSMRIKLQADSLKLQIQNQNAAIKVEVNQGMRGILDPVETRELCQKTQVEFDSFCSIACVPFAQLYGGKICAALDRQHPRDLFDVKYLLENEGFTDDIKRGFLLCLLSSKRPILEMLFPHYTDQEQAYKNQFEGMTQEQFSYKDLEQTREHLVQIIHQNVNKIDVEFLLDFEDATPDWSTYNFEQFPAVQWKLLNIRRLKSINPDKHKECITTLKRQLQKVSS